MQYVNCYNRNGAKIFHSQNREMDIEWIRKQFEETGKSQAGLARKLGLDPAGITRLLAGNRRLQAAEVPLVHEYFGTAEAQLGFNERTPLQPPQRVVQVGDRIPVLGIAEAGPDGWSLWNGDIVDYVPRPANLASAMGAYAVFVTGSSMEPRYHAGELVHVHPAKPITPGAYVLLQIAPPVEGEAPRALLKRLVRRTTTKVIVEQFNPAKEFDLLASKIISMHRIVGSAEY